MPSGTILTILSCGRVVVVRFLVRLPNMVSHSLANNLVQLLDGEWHDVKKISGLRGSAKAYLVSLVARRMERPILIVTPTAKGAENLADDIAFFLGEAKSSVLNRRIQLFPSWDILPVPSNTAVTPMISRISPITRS